MRQLRSKTGQDKTLSASLRKSARSARLSRVTPNEQFHAGEIRDGWRLHLAA